LQPFNIEKVGLSNGITTSALMITDKCENPEVIAAWADYGYTEEGGREYMTGVKDLNWEYLADGVNFQTINADKYKSGFQYHLQGSGEVPCYKAPSNSTNNVSTDPVVKRYNEESLGTFWGNGNVLPSLILDAEEKEKASIILTDLGTYIKNYFAEVVVGKQDLESTWEKFKSTCKDMGADELVKIYQGAYDKAISK